MFVAELFFSTVVFILMTVVTSLFVTFALDGALDVVAGASTVLLAFD